MKNVIKKEESLRLNKTFDEIIKASALGNPPPKPKAKKPSKKKV
jgi:hypothetical protein